MEWIIPSLTGGGLVLAIVALLKYRPEIRKLRADAGKVQAEAAAISDDSIRETFQALLQEQRQGFEAQIGPLREELTRQGAEIRMLREEVAEVRTKYWRGIQHIRALLRWIGEHVHDGHASVPTAPAEIAGDI